MWHSATLLTIARWRRLKRHTSRQSIDDSRDQETRDSIDDTQVYSYLFLYPSTCALVLASDTTSHDSFFSIALEKHSSEQLTQ